MCYNFCYLVLEFLLLHFFLIFQEIQKTEESQVFLDIWEGRALLFSGSIHTSLILPMAYEQVIVGWRRDLVL